MRVVAVAVVVSCGGDARFTPDELEQWQRYAAATCACRVPCSVPAPTLAHPIDDYTDADQAAYREAQATAQACLDQHRDTASTRVMASRRASPDRAATAGLAPEDVRRVVRRKQPRFQFCYEKAPTPTGGRLDIRAAIDGDGRVTQVSAAGSTLLAAATDCILDEFRSLAFPPPRDGATTVTYPMRFR